MNFLTRLINRNSAYTSKAKLLRSESGFTLIEVLIVLVVIGVLIPTLFSILGVVIRQQTKVAKLQEIKSQGDYVTTFIENIIQQTAINVYDDQNLTNEICDPSNSPARAQTSNGEGFFFSTSVPSNYIKIVSAPDLDNPDKQQLFYVENSSGVEERQPLVTGNVTVDNVSFICQAPNVTTDRYLIGRFTLNFFTNAEFIRPEEQTSITYTVFTRF